jgi:DNA ligase
MTTSVLLAKNWSPDINPTGWLMSEKLDGVRAVWDGRRLVSRLGNTIPAPKWLLDELPGYELDGELWLGRGNFQECVSVVKCASRDNGWSKISYMVFDAPDNCRPFEARLERARAAATKPHVTLVPHVRCEGQGHLDEALRKVQAQGGEGLMLRRAGSLYERTRSSSLLKVKTFQDAEARVIGHEPGKGRHHGRLGALRLRRPDGVEFSCGTGFTDAERERPPRVGSVVTYRYQELTKDGVPRFPAFVTKRDYE